MRDRWQVGLSPSAKNLLVKVDAMTTQYARRQCSPSSGAPSDDANSRRMAVSSFGRLFGTMCVVSISKYRHSGELLARPGDAHTTLPAGRPRSAGDTAGAASGNAGSPPLLGVVTLPRVAEHPATRPVDGTSAMSDQSAVSAATGASATMSVALSDNVGSIVMRASACSLVTARYSASKVVSQPCS